MAFVSSRASVLAALAFALTPPACSSGDNDETSVGESTITTAPAGTTGEPTTGDATTEPTTEPAGTTTDEPGTSTTSSTSTTDEPTTDEPTTDPSSSGDDTGPICGPGQPNCVCDDGTCVDGYVCQMGVCGEGGLVCPGDVEPPEDAEDTPVELGDISDDDDDFFEQGGVLSGATDVDWYHLHGADTFGHVAEPTLTLTAGTQRSCLFLECDNGGVALTTVECPAGTDFAISPKLRPGCCGSATFTIKDIGCPGQDESMQMWARLDKPPADICSEYDFKIHF